MGGNPQRPKMEGVGKQLIIGIKDSLWCGSWVWVEVWEEEKEGRKETKLLFINYDKSTLLYHLCEQC